MSEVSDRSPLVGFGPNPVLGREVVERTRSARYVVILVVYLALLAGMLYLTYRIGILTLRDVGLAGGGIGGASLGRLMFETLLLALTLLIAFIVPGTAAGAIAGEKERRTLSLLQVTLLSPRSIILGKLGASIAFALLLLVATAPLFAVPLVLGGVSIWQVVKGLLVLLAIAFFLASLALLMSTLARRVQFATVNAYALTFFLLFGTLMAWGVEAIFRSQLFGNPGHPVSVYFNPIIAIADAVGETSGIQFTPSPLSGIKTGLASQIRFSNERSNRPLGRAQVGAAQEEIVFSGPVTGPPAPAPALTAQPPAAAPDPNAASQEPPGQNVAKTEVASGEVNGVRWTFSASQTAGRSRPSSVSTCLEFSSPVSGEGTCSGDTSNIDVRTSSVEGETFVYGQVPKNAKKVRIELTGADQPAEVDPIAKEGFERNFFVHQVGGLRAVAVVAIAEDGSELLRRPVVPNFAEPQPIPNDVQQFEPFAELDDVTTWVWPVHTVLLLLLSVLFLEAASRRIRTPSRRMLPSAGGGP